MDKTDNVVDWALHRNIFEDRTVYRNLARLGGAAVARLRWWIANPGSQTYYAGGKPMPVMRGKAIQALGTIGGQVSLEATQEFLASSAHWSDRAALIDGLEAAENMPQQLLVVLQEWLPHETVVSGRLRDLVDGLVRRQQAAERVGLNTVLRGPRARRIGECP